MIRIAAEHISPRLRYVCSELFGESHEIMHCHGSPSEQPDIWYSASPAPSGSIQIIPHGFLNQTGTDLIDPKPGRVGEIPALFVNDLLPDQFDVFSATFYLLSRYEEYQATENDRDEMGRYKAESSVLWAMGCLETPVIESWRSHLLTLVGRSGDAQPITKITSTIDIDSAFAYRHKGLYRTIGGIGKDILSLDFTNLFSRIISLMRLSNDPYDTYALIEDLNRERKIPIQWFFLLADFGKYDKGLPYQSKALRALIRRLDGKHQVGIHPGVNSNTNENILQTEINRVVDITRRPCVHARQHYLILSLPLTYQRYINAGIRHDHSMGYAEHPGFRAGTSRPFHWYDLSSESQTELVIHPFACMDTTLNKYLGLGPEQALERLRRIIDNTFEHKGHFTSLWHNETLSEKGIWKGWRKVYVEMSDYLAFKRDNA